MLNEQQRQERDPAALQIELLAIEHRMMELGPEMIDSTQLYNEARTHFEVVKAELKILKSRQGNIQSVLRSLPRE